MKPYLKIATLFALLIVATSCTHNSKNSIFEKFKPSSAEYKQELAKQLQSLNADDLTFLFNNYVVIDGKEYLDILIKGSGIDAQGLVLVNSWDKKIQGIKATKGMGYSGAELKNLKIAVIDNNANANLLYKEVGKIID